MQKTTIQTILCIILLCTGFESMTVVGADDQSIEDVIRFKVDRAGYIRQFDPIFQKPIDHGKDAIPVGNGDLAAVAWQPDHLTWMLNKCDIGGASQVARIRIETPNPISTRVGTLETRLSLENAVGTISYSGGKLPQSSGWMWRGKSGSAPKVTDNDLGYVMARFHVTEGQNVFMLSYDEKSKVAHPTSIIFERWIQKQYGKNVTAIVRDKTIAIVYKMSKNSHVSSYAAVLAFDGFKGASLKQKGPVSASLDIPEGTVIKGRIAVAVVTSLESKDPLAAATTLATDALKKTEADHIAGQEKYWTDFWNRFHVDAGHPYLTALYHISLYQLGITSRGARPVKFNGALNLFSEESRTWGTGYWCHNQSESYLQCYTANHSELVDNFHDWIARIRPEAIRAGQKKFQTKGAHYPEVMKWDFKITDPETPKKPSGVGMILSSGVRYSLMMWNRYRYSLDEPFLKEKAYPVIRDCAEFYANYAKLGKDGRYHISPTMSWEEQPIGIDAHADCAAWRAIFPIAIQAAETLGTDAKLITRWKERLEKAPLYPVEDDLFSVIQRPDGTPEPTDHFQWQLPNLSGVFPYSVIGIDSEAKLKRLAEDTFKRYRFNADAGHEFLPVIAARLGNAEWWRAAMFQYIQSFQVHDQGLLHYYNITGNKVLELGDSDGAHPYLEGSGIMATGVNEMLLQSHGGLIRVFPAVPDRWSTQFKLRAEGSFLVASEHRGRVGIPYIAIKAVGGKKRLCRIAVPWKVGAEIRTGKKKVTFKLNDGCAEFMAVPGVVYVLTPTDNDIDDVPILDVGFKKQYSPCRLGNVWIGSRDGAMNHTADFPLW